MRVSKSEHGPVFWLPTIYEAMATNLRRPYSRWLHPPDCRSVRSSLSPGNPSGRITSFLWWAPLSLPFPVPGLQGTGVLQFKALFHVGKLSCRAAMLGLTPSNQRIGGPTRTITWISEVGPKGWVQQGEEQRAPGEEGAGSKAALAFHRLLWSQRSCLGCGAKVSPCHGEAVTWPRPGINAAFRHQRPGRRKKKRKKNCYQIYEVLLCTKTCICVDPVNEKIAAGLSQRIVRIK